MSTEVPIFFLFHPPSQASNIIFDQINFFRGEFYILKLVLKKKSDKGVFFCTRSYQLFTGR